MVEWNGVVTGEEDGDFPGVFDIIESGGAKSSIGGGKGENGVMDEGVAAAEIGEMWGVEESGPAVANEGERRKGRGWHPREAFQNDVVGEGWNGGGQRRRRRMGMRLLWEGGFVSGNGGGGVMRIGEARFHEPWEVAGVAAFSLWTHSGERNNGIFFDLQFSGEREKPMPNHINGYRVGLRGVMILYGQVDDKVCRCGAWKYLI